MVSCSHSVTSRPSHALSEQIDRSAWHNHPRDHAWVIAGPIDLENTMKWGRTTGSRLRPTSCRYSMASARCKAYSIARGPILTHDVNLQKKPGGGKQGLGLRRGHGVTRPGGRCERGRDRDAYLLDRINRMDRIPGRERANNEIHACPPVAGNTRKGIREEGWRKSRRAIYSNPTGVFPYGSRGHLSPRTPRKPHGGPPCGESRLMS